MYLVQRIWDGNVVNIPEQIIYVVNTRGGTDIINTCKFPGAPGE